MRVLILLAAFAMAGAPAAASAQDSPPDLAPCGMDDRTIPDFTLQDQITNSPTYGQGVSLSDFAGKVVLVYWLTAT